MGSRLLRGTLQSRVETGATINATVSSLDFASTGGANQYFNIITTGSAWSFVSASSWINGGPTTGPIGTTQVNLNCDDNPGAARTGEVRMKTNNPSKYIIIIVNQAGV